VPVAEDCVNLRQGDVVNGVATPAGMEEAPLGVAILSQTCDVVQRSKSRCLVAPVIPSDANLLRDARKGRKPLHLYLDSGSKDGPAPCIVDMERAVSVSKSELSGARLSARYVVEESSSRAGDLAARIGRAFNRFPFPNEVYPFFGELRSRVQSKAGTPGPFGQVVDLVSDLRISSDQWPKAGRRMKLYVILTEELLIPRDDYDPGWVWGNERVLGLTTKDRQESLTLNRVCELILANESGDSTTRAVLWGIFGERLVSELLRPKLSVEVVQCDVDVVSDSEFTYRQYLRTESLDLEVLSDSSLTA
jgi:hypothetical protein